MILANLVLGENVVPEHAAGATVTPDLIAAGLVPLLGDTPERRRQLEAFARLDAIMDLAGEPPSQAARRSRPARHWSRVAEAFSAQSGADLLCRTATALPGLSVSRQNLHDDDSLGA